MKAENNGTKKEIRSGLIFKAISGYFYVLTENKEVYTCGAKGAFRKSKIPPLVGDYIDFEITSNDELKGVISSINPRKNEFRRPPFANLDTLFIIVSINKPSPNFLNIDKLLIICEYKNIKPIIVLTKIDLEDEGVIQEFVNIYEKAGYDVVKINNNQPDNIDEIKETFRPYIKGNICGFAGNTGVGKSSLLNNISPELTLLTGEISEKLGRGKHTTRHIELFYIEEFDGYVADTPGFGSVDMLYYAVIMKQDLASCFIEFEPYINECKFNDCNHLCEKGCAVIKAVEDDVIAYERHENYVFLYKECEKLKSWDL